MSIAAAFDLEIKSFDVINAYVNAELITPILYEIPPILNRYDNYDRKRHYFKLYKALYGLKTSANLWYNNFVASLNEFDLHQVPGVNCLFTNNWLIILFFVDDIIAVYSSKNALKFADFNKKLLAKYKIRILGDTENFLSIRILRKRSSRRLYLALNTFIEKITNKFHIPTTDKPPKTPLPPHIDLSAYTGQASIGQIREYQQKVGSINYAAINTRPDIARTSSKLSKHLRNPSPQHIETINHLIQYL